MKKISFKTVIMRSMTIVAVLLSLLIMINDQGTGSIIAATLILIAGIACWMMSSADAYNAGVDNIKRVDGAKDISIETYYQAFQEVVLPLGKPHLGTVKGIKNNCLIWGPNANEEFIYVYKNGSGDSVYIAYSEMGRFAEPDQTAEAKRQATDYEELLCYQLNNACMVEDVRQMVEQYTNHHTITPPPAVSEGRLYRFNEDFTLKGQNFQLCQMNGDALYDIKGIMPLKNFRINSHENGEELYQIRKRLFHILPRYEFYYKGSSQGMFQKKMELSHNTFTMALPEGQLLMKSVTATFGENYRVSIDGRIIGTIAEKLNLSLENIVFNNYVIHVREEKYTALMAALGVMAVREDARNRQSVNP